MSDKKRIMLNAFDMACVTHQSAGTWRHPESQASRYNDLEYWTNLAIELERGHFDCLFIADVLGPYDVFRGSAEAAIKDAAQTPVNDPFGAIPAMATVTKHLGFGVTASTTFEHPYLLARRLSTLDHLTKGRVAWNVVSSYLASASRNVGMDKQIPHDERYDVADEYMEVMYKLWEGSWEEGAVKRCRKSGVFTDAAKVHPIEHEGKYFKVPGFHMCEPSPQRTPVIFQAGASGRGRTFGAANGEGIFVLTNSPESAKPLCEDFRRRAVEAGRSADSLKIFTMLTVITGKDDAAAQAKFDEYLDYASPEGMLALYGGWSGMDFSQLDPDAPLEAAPNDSLRTALESLVNAGDGSSWSIREVIRHRCIGGVGPVLVGGPETIADKLERWVDYGGVDGFNLAYAITPGSVTDFIDYIVPELIKRGRVQTEYKPGTFRQKLIGTEGPYTEDSHPAAKWRGYFAGKGSVACQTHPQRFETNFNVKKNGADQESEAPKIKTEALA